MPYLSHFVNHKMSIFQDKLINKLLTSKFLTLKPLIPQRMVWRIHCKYSYTRLFELMSLNIDAGIHSTQYKL